MKDPVFKINLLIRAETALARVRARRTANRVILSLIALVFVLIGVAMLNLSIYKAFASFTSSGLASLYVSLINLGLAGIIFAAIGKAGVESNEEKMAAEIRDLAVVGVLVGRARLRIGLAIVDHGSIPMAGRLSD